MRSHLASNPQDPNGDLGNGDMNFVPTAFGPSPGLGGGTPIGSTPPTPPQPVAPVLPDESVQAMAAVSGSGSGGTGSVVAETSSSGFTINLVFDAAAMAAPASFRAGIEQAAAILSATITNKITVNLDIDYSGTGGGAAAGPDNGEFVNYSTVRADLIANAAPGDTSFNALPTGSTIQGQSQVAVWNAQLKLFGLISPNSTTTDDGSATFATDINPNLLVGVALHELTHAIGRVPYGSEPDIFDFYRFTSPGTRLFTDNIPASSAYFSLDGGNTKLADFGISSDPSDFLNAPSSNLTPNDAFDEFYSNNTLQSLTTVDLQMLDALGFNTTPLGLVVVGNSAEALQGRAAISLLSSAPNINDPGSTTLASATIKIANASGSAVAGDELFVNGIENGSLGNGVTASWNATTDTLTLSGTASAAVYDTLLNEITFQDTGTDATSGSHPVRTVTWTINDGTNSYNATSTIEIDRAPVAANNSATDVVGTTLSTTAANGVLSNASDLDSDGLTVTGVSDTAQGAGSVGSALAGVYGHLTLNANGSYSYVADNTSAISAAPNGLLHDSFTYTVSDGNGGTSSAVLNIAVDRLPVVTTSNISEAPGHTVAASSLFTVSDPNGFAITEYQFWDSTSDPASGHFFFNGVEVAARTVLDVTAAQLSEVTFVAGTDPTALQVRAFDGVNWSAADAAQWAPFTVDVATTPPPVVTTSNVTLDANQTVAASSLFRVSDPNSFAITEYQFWDSTSDPNSGHFYLNGVEVADHTLLDVTAAQLSEVTFVASTDPTSLQVRAFDGVNWSAADTAQWAPFTVDVATTPPPVVTTSNVTLDAHQTVAASSLFTVSDPNSFAITEYQLWDATSDPNSGHFYLNGVEVADHTLIDVTAAQLSEVTFVAGTDPTSLQVRAFDGVNWSAADTAQWAPFNVNVALTPPPVVTTSNITLDANQTVAASSLFTVSDPNSFAITEYQFWDSSTDPASGHFYFNGVEVAARTVLDVTAAQLSEVTFVTGTDPTSLQVRAFDGVNWSAVDTAQWAPFTVSVAATSSAAAIQNGGSATASLQLVENSSSDNFHFSNNSAGAAAQTPIADSMPFSNTAFANSHVEVTGTHEDAFGASNIPDAAHLWAHHSGFHFV